MDPIAADVISFHASVSEDELRDRIAQEVLEQIGGLGPDGKKLPGISVKVLRGKTRAGGYTIEVSGPAPARISLPAPKP